MPLTSPFKAAFALLIVSVSLHAAEVNLPQATIDRINEDFLDRYQIALVCSKGVASPQIKLFAENERLYMLRDSNSSIGTYVAELRETESNEYYHEEGMRFREANIANTSDFFISSETLKKGEGELTVILYRDIYKCDAKLRTWPVEQAISDRLKMEADVKLLEEQQRKAEAEAEAERKAKAKAKAEREAKAKAQAEAKRRAEEAAKQRAEAEKRANRVVGDIQGYIQGLLQQAWRIPSTARNGMSAVVEINLYPSGEIQKAFIATSSGDEEFDRSVLVAAHRVGRFERVSEVDPDLFERRIRRVLVTFRPEGMVW